MQRFQQIVTGRKADDLDAWLEDVAQRKLPELASFANTLGKGGAVRAALTSQWSNGQVEGHVNRLKMIKRMMYERAKPDLLRARVLHAV
ncbi:MAG: transposase [Acidobacteriota bacterium]|nr:transposase [Acidobacteriota bacterium]